MTNPTTLHIAVLECDTPIAAVQDHYGSYGDIFERFLRQSLSLCHVLPTGIDLVVSKWPVVQTQRYPSPDEVDAILLTGSKYNAFDNDPWIIRLTEYIRAVLDNIPPPPPTSSNTKQTPIIGICFGHQIVARALGISVERNPQGWEVSVNEIGLSEVGQKIFGRDTLSLHQMHHDIISMPAFLTASHSGSICQNLGSTPKCAIQGLYQANRLLTLQGHPEFDAFITSHIVQSRLEQGIFVKEIYEDAQTRARLGHDGLCVGSAVLEFAWGSRRR